MFIELTGVVMWEVSSWERFEYRLVPNKPVKRLADQLQSP